MAKKTVNPVDKLKAADKKHNQNTEQYVKIVSTLYNKAIEDLSALALMIKDFGDDEDFSFDKNPGIAKKAEEVVLKLSERISAIVDRGSRSEWLGACAKSTQFIEDVLNVSKLTKQTLQKYNDRNLEALAAFQDRKVEGMNLSERVWKMVAPMKDEVELAVDTSNKYYKNGINSSKSLTKMDRAIGQGTSAAELSRDVRSCLLEPNKLFRRVRDKHGNLTLSKAAKLYHPGQGVYRSSYKNAMRMTRTEINMAYRQSDHMRWQQLDFVVGIKVQTSNNHTVLDPKSKGRLEMHDLCDKLAGSYPKEFKFVGWHPQCRCFATPILKTLEEVDKDVDANGNYNNLPSANQVYDVPQNFKDYVADNEERMNGWKSTPYYLKDNPQYVDEALHPEKYIKKPLVLDQDTFKRLSDFEMYGFNHQRSTLFNESLVKAKLAQLEGDLDAFEAAMADMQFRMEKNEASTASKAKNKKTAEQIRAEKIQAAHDKRAAERTEERVHEINEFIKKHEKRTVEVMDNLRADINKASLYRDIDVRQATDVLTGSVGVETSKGVASYSLERMQKESEMLNMRMAELVDEAKKLTYLIPDAVDQLKFYTLDELKSSHDEIKNIFVTLSKEPLSNQVKIIEDVLSSNDNKFVNDALKVKLEDVKLEIRIQDILPLVNNFLKITENTNVKVWRDTALSAEAALNNRNPVDAEKLVEMAKNMQFAAEKYDQLKATGYSTKKFDKAMQDCIDSLNAGDVANANKYILLAETTKRINEESNARKKEQRQNKKTNEDVDAVEEKKKPGEAQNIDEIIEVMGKELPFLLDKYKDSIKRQQYTREGYLKKSDKIEKALKAFFDDSKFSHCTSSELLDERILENGIITNLQEYSLKHNGRKYADRAGDYDQRRRSYGHFAYGLTTVMDNTKEEYEKMGDWEATGIFGKKQSVIPKEERLGDGDYYRCGIPVPKDLDEAWKNYRSGYGGMSAAQIILRKENLVTTFTYCNSLQQHTIPSLTNDPKICSIDNQNFNALTSDGKIDREKVKREAGYIEIQYLPKRSEGKILPKDMESITLPKHPESIHSKEIWDKWKKEGVDVYYYDYLQDKVVLYQKGYPLISKEEAEKIVKDMLARVDEYVTADISMSRFDVVKSALDKGDVMSAYDKIRSIKEEYDKNKTILDSFIKYIPDAKDWNKKFTVEEIRGAYEAIEKQMRWMENSFADRNDPDKVITKWAKIARYVKNPELIDPTKSAHKTWEIAFNAYNNKRDELIYQYRKDSIEKSIDYVKSFKTKDKVYLDLMNKLDVAVQSEKWGSVEEIIEEAKKKIIELSGPATGKKLEVGECSSSSFSEEDFSQIRKDAAKWFAAKSNSKSAMIQAFKEADDYMSKYAEELWKNLTQEEKHILWLYTDGSKYINEEMLGLYNLRMKSWIDGTYRNGLQDANVLTSIIEKAPKLKDDMWMQSGKSSKAFSAIFGKEICGTDLSKLVGVEGTSEVFMSCHAARDGAFTKSANTGSENNVVLSIYMPKGTKGVYTEPFASYGDSKRGDEGVNWNGKKRDCPPSDQVEFVLQRGAKFRITKATFDKKTNKYYVDVELIEQCSRSALSTNVKNIDSRFVRYKAPNS